MVLEKGKEKVVAGGGKGKRKWRDGKGDEDKTGRRNRKNRGVLQFFEDEAYHVEDDEDSSDESFFDDDDFAEEELSSDKVHSGTGKAAHLPFAPKEEEMSEEELERMVEERYRSRSGLVTYAEDCYDRKSSIDRDIFLPSAKGQIWKLKCTMGRERYSTLCLMQKFAELENLGRKLLIISACALDNVKGYIFIEADKQNDVYEACKGLSTIYATRMTIVPSNEISRLLLVKSKSCGISVGMWARVKNGRYKGDLAKVAAVNVTRRKVTVKLVPRIDVKAMAEKFGGGVTARRNAIPPQRLISPSELEDFRPLIQIRKDRDTNETFEFLDGMMLKDGYVYKKIPMDSLTFWGITPSDDELAKFEPGKKVESANLEWISQLLGKKKEVEVVNKDKGGGKSEGSSSFSIGNDFEVEDLVFIGRKDFGIVIGMEKDNSVKILKAGSGGPSVDAVKRNELKIASFDKKLFSVSDQHLNLLTVNDSVRILEGPLKDRQGIVKKIYKGVLFLFDEAEEKNNGYLCVKANICEKIKLSDAESTEQGGDRDPSIFADPTSSPKTPLSPDQSFQDRDNKNSFPRHDDAVFSVGQSLRIRIGPLKGYLCRVLAVRRSEVTVKLDSMHKILTVKCDHLSEVRGRNSAVGQGEEQGSFKPFSFLGSQDGASDWMDGVKLQTEDNGWNARQPTERTSWAAFPSSNFSLSKESGSGNSGDGDAKKAADSEDSSWQKKATADQDSSWGSTAVNRKIPDDGPSNGWGAPGQGISGDTLRNESWGKADASKSNTSWGCSGISSGEQTGNPINAGADSDKPEKHSWENDVAVVDKLTEGTSQDNDVASESKWNRTNSDATGCGSSWGKQKFESSCERAGDEVLGTKNEAGSSWSKHEKGSGWNKSDGGSCWKNQSSSFKVAENSSWGQQLDINAEDKGKGWNVPTDGNVSHDGRSGIWNRPNSDAAGCGSSWGKQDFKSSCENAGGAPSGTKKDGGSSWSKHEEGSAWDKADGGSSWKNESSTCEPAEKSSWGGKPNTNAEDKDKGWKMPNDGNASGGGWGKGGWSTSGTSETDSKKNSWSGGSNWNSGSNDRGGENQEDDTYSNGGRGGSWNGGRGDRDNFRGRGRFGRQGFRGRGSERGGFGGRGGFDGDGSLGSDSQDDTYNNSGRGGRWSGGQGGRGDRGGFRGRGGSDHGGFGGRGSEGGGFRGRGGRDWDGFRGRGRGRVGNWRNDGDDSNVDNKSYSWGQGSNNDVGGWKSTSSGGSWNQGSSDNNPPKSWTSSQTKWGSSNAGNAQKESGTSGWGSSNAGNAQKESGTSGWGSSNAGKAQKESGTSGWGSSNAGTAQKESGGWGSSNAGNAQKESGTSGWGSSNAGKAQKESGTSGWGSSNSGTAQKESGGWGSSNAGNAQKESGTSGWGSSNAGKAQKESGTSGWGSSNAGTAQKESGGWGSSDVGDAGKDSGTGGWGSSNAGDARKDGGTSGWGSSNTGDARKEVGAGSWGSSNAGDARKESATGAWGSSNAGDAQKESATGAWGSSNAGEAGQSKESNKDKVPSNAWVTASAGSREEKSSDGWQASRSNKEGPSDDAWGKAAKSSWGSGSGSGNDKGGW